MIGAEALWNDKIKDNPFLLVNPVYGAQVQAPEQAAYMQLAAAQGAQYQQAALMNAGLAFSGGAGGSITELVAQQQAQLRGARRYNNPGDWRVEPMRIHPLTAEEKDLMEAKAEVERICKEVKDQYELYDWVASNEVEAIAPGWKE